MCIHSVFFIILGGGSVFLKSKSSAPTNEAAQPQRAGSDAPIRLSVFMI